MTVGNKSPVSSNNVNSSFASKSANNTYTGKQRLERTGSGAPVDDAQLEINDLKSSDASQDIAIGQNTTDIATNSSNITTNSNNIATNQSNISTNSTNITGNATDITNLENRQVTGAEGVQRTLGTDLTSDAEFKLDVNGLTTEAGIDTAADFLAFYDTSAGEHRKIAPDDLGITGGGSGEFNYYEAPNDSAEEAPLGFTEYANTSLTLDRPDDFGGVTDGSISIARNTTNPLFGTGDFQLDKTAVDARGRGVYFEADVRTGDLTQVLRQFWGVFKTSANYADGDVRFYAVFSNDNFVADFQVVEPAATEIFATDKNKYIAELQVPSSATALKVRLCLHVASTNATAYTINFDDNRFGPSQVATGPIVTDWEEYTPTISNFGTTSNVKFFWRRNGDSLDIKGQFQSGTTVAGQAQVSLPSGISVAGTDRIDGTNSSVVGYWTQNADAIEGNRAILVNSGDTGIFFGYLSSGQNGFSKQNANNLPVASTETIVLSAQSIPISGWSSNTTLSTDYGNRLIAAHAYSTGQSISSVSETTIELETTEFDTTASHNTTTYTYTIPESGLYAINASLHLGNAANEVYTIRVKRGGTETLLSREYSSGTVNPQPHVEGVKELSAGDEITLTLQSTADASYAIQSDDTVGFFIYKLSSPQSIGQSETLALKYTSSSGQVVSSGATDIIDFSNKTFNTHGSVTTGASWRFTAPSSGFYEIASAIRYSVVAGRMTEDDTAELLLYKNGSLDTVLMQWESKSTPTNAQSVQLQGSIKVELDQGDYIDIRSTHTFTTAANLFPDGTINYINISRAK